MIENPVQWFFPETLFRRVWLTMKNNVFIFFILSGGAIRFISWYSWIRNNMEFPPPPLHKNISRKHVTGPKKEVTFFSKYFPFIALYRKTWLNRGFFRGIMTAHGQLVELDLSDNAFGPIGNIYAQGSTRIYETRLDWLFFWPKNILPCSDTINVR